MVDFCENCEKRPATHIISRSTPGDLTIERQVCDLCHADYKLRHGWKPIHILDFLDVGKVKKAMLTGTPLTELGLNISRIGEIQAFLQREEDYRTILEQTKKA